ncbi:MAG: BNR-4 repeat-containing protein [Candidatus Latescibacteria bacterium]|nr:BNR-4 repeat-containing protein [Candidatus Latescibacterota bacterium]
MDTHIELSREGSDRATAYSMSSKIVRHCDRLFVGWLDAPEVNGGMARVMLGICDGKTGALLKTVQLGEGKDNHCGPAMVLDRTGRLHALVGAHHDPFLYRWSDTPEDEDSWSEPVPLGPQDTYPSLCADAEGNLHVAFRVRDEQWQLHYRRKKSGKAWEDPVSMAISPMTGYNHFMHDLNVGPTGTLHLTFHFHYGDRGGGGRDCKGKAASYLFSRDGGDTWLNDGDPCKLPLTIETVRTFVQGYDDPDYDLRIGNHVVDQHDHVWLFASMPDPPRGVIWRRSGDGWQVIELNTPVTPLDLADGKSTALSYDDQGRVHMLAGTNPDGQRRPWYDTGHEVFYLVLDAEGNVEEVTQLTENNPNAARWLPSIEKWDWTRPEECCQDGHWFTYTLGINAGLISQKDYNFAEKTGVFLGKRPL